jgi:DNA topoisomerase-2
MSKNINTATQQAKNYKTLNDIDHLRKRPDLYLGAKTTVSLDLDILTDKTNKIVNKKVNVTISYMNVLEEIILNAFDQIYRTLNNNDVNKTDTIKISCNYDKNIFSVYNNGSGLAINKLKSGKWLPESIYTESKSGTNFDDNKIRYSCGRNGMGAFSVGASSDKLLIKTQTGTTSYIQKIKCDGKKFYIDCPKINKQEDEKKYYTTITFITCKEIRNNKSLLTLKNIIRRRCVEMNLFFNCNLKIFYNNKQLTPEESPNNLTDFVKKYIIPNDSKMVFLNHVEGKIKSENNKKIIIANDWKLCVWVNRQGNKRILSYVNGIYTMVKNSTHVKFIRKIIREELFNNLPREYKKMVKGPLKIKKYISFVVIVYVDKAQYSGQTKSELMTPEKNLPKIKIPSAKIKNFIKASQLLKILDEDFKSTIKMGAKRKVKNIISNKYFPATDWKKKNNNCVLLVTEGNSATSQVQVGLEELGKEGSKIFGIFSLKGKPINAYKNKDEKISNNAEFRMLIDILNIKSNVDYTNEKNFKLLRYKQIYLVTDADPDGYHISGLFISFLYKFFPSVVEDGNFIKFLRTPYIRVYLKNRLTKICWSKTDYENWEKPISQVPYVIKECKGIGSNSKKEIKEIFSNIQKNIVSLDNDNKANESLELAFDDNSNGDTIKSSDLRKNWIRIYKYNPNITFDKTNITVSNFVNNQIVQYAKESLIRCIPTIDGLKNVNKKIIYGLKKMKKGMFGSETNKKFPKILTIMGSLITITGYAHGDTSLNNSIFSMGKEYLNELNLGLIEPHGGFGSHINSECSQARYVCARPISYLKLIFRSEDDPILPHKYSDYEPDFYVPIIPLILINGVKTGIATGFSTKILPHNITHMIEKIKLYLMYDGDMEKVGPFVPWFIGYDNDELLDEEINQKTGKKKYIARSHFYYDKINGILNVLELPVYVSEIKFKDICTKLSGGDKYKKKGKTTKPNASISKKDFIVEDHVRECKPYGINNRINYRIMVKLSESYKNKLNEMKTYKINETLEKDFKLINKKLTETNMHILDENMNVVKYEHTSQIFEKYCQTRLNYYKIRKQYYIKKMEHDLLVLKYKILFVEKVLNKDIIFNKKTTKQSLIQQMETHIENIKKYFNGSYKIFYNQKMITMTVDKLKKLKNKYKLFEKDLVKYKNTSLKNMWINELNILEKDLKKWKKI